MRRVFAAVVVLVVALACAATARPAVTFVLKGNGWGHGLGLAQYGAEGYAADEGRDYAWIVDHYYPGTTLGDAGVGRVRVLLKSGVSQLSIGSTKPFKVTDANGKKYNLDAGTYTLGTALQIRSANGQLRALASPARFDPGSAVLRVSGVRYRGRFRVRLQGGRLSLVNDVPLEPYVKGVIAGEMPASWHPEALKAQAVVARTFGLYVRKTGQWFDLYDDTRSQVYGGVGAERPSTNAAVDATKGKVVRSGGALALTVYHSTSGGKTASVSDEWGSNQASYPYLVGVPDAYDAISPHHRWGPTDAEQDCPTTVRDCVWTGAALKRALGSAAPSSITDFRVLARNSSSRVARTRLVGPSGSTTQTGGTLRSVLRLRSTWFWIGVLRITGGGSIRRGQSKVLHVLTRSLSNVTLQRKVGSGPWTNVRPVSGSVNVTVKPGATSLYRLRSPAAASGAVKVTVKTASGRIVTAAAPELAVAQELVGTGGPGDVVQVQRRVDGGSWVTVAVALVHGDGTWRAAVEPVRGEYRVYVGSSVAGVEPTLTLG
jgi:SpoIID/LytB domain protein